MKLLEHLLQVRILNKRVDLVVLSHPEHHREVLENLRFILNAHPGTLHARLSISRQGSRKCVDVKHLIDSHHRALIFVRDGPSFFFLSRLIGRIHFLGVGRWIPHMRLLFHIPKSRLLINLLNLVDHRLVAKICLIAIVGAHVDHAFSIVLPKGSPIGLILLRAHLLLQRFERGVICVLEDFANVELFRLEWLELVVHLIGSISLGSKRLDLETIVVLNLHFQESVSVRELTIVI